MDLEVLPNISNGLLLLEERVAILAFKSENNEVQLAGQIEVSGLDWGKGVSVGIETATSDNFTEVLGEKSFKSIINKFRAINTKRKSIKG
jgi:hypothetical protein